MAKPKIVWNDEDFVALMKSDEVRGVLLEQAEAVASRAGDGYEAEAGNAGRTRSRAFARAVTGEAIRDNARHATLLRALGR